LNELSLAIRRAKLKDVRVLEDLFLQASSLSLERGEILRKVLKDVNSELIVSEFNGKVVGFIHQIFISDPFHGGLNSYIVNLFVKESCRNMEIGSQLVRKALKNAEKKGVIEVHVDTEESNENAIRFYESHGFRKVGIILEKSFFVLYKLARKNVLT
jgi:ribosomal protein S18 acetylase RimI-like enzyme